MNYSETALLEVTGTTQTTNESDKDPAWFNQFLEDYDYETPKKGQVLEGKILRIDEDALLVDVGMKRDAIVPNRDLNSLDDDVLDKLSVGDKILVYVLRPPVGDQDLLVSLNKGIEHENWDQAEACLEDGTTLDLEVVGHNRGGLLVNFESLRGFLPFSQVPELRRTRDPKRAEEIKRSMIGTQLTVKIIEVNRKRRRLIFSARAAQEERRNKRLEELEKDQIIHGPVVNIVKFGIFVDLDGVDGLVHISKLDWQRIDHPSDLFKVGDEVDVKVIDIDIERERVSLDRKSLLPSPWDTFEQQHQPGETIEGRITNVLDFGAFVEVADGVEGLVHVSEIGYSSSGNPRDVVKKDETVLVRILDIDTERERISLSMRQVPLERQIAWSLENSELAEASAENETETSEEITAPESDAEATVVSEGTATGEGEMVDAVGTAEVEAEAQAEISEIEAAPESEIEVETTAQVGEVEVQPDEPVSQIDPIVKPEVEAIPEAQTEAKSIEQDEEANAQPSKPVSQLETQSEGKPEETPETEVETPVLNE